ncbi:MAG: glycosyltransferase family 4 protein [Melioribacteraceae bacterium]
MKKTVLMIIEHTSIPSDTIVWQDALTLNSDGFEVIIISPKSKLDYSIYENKSNIKIFRHPRFFDGSSVFLYILEYLEALFWEAIYLIFVLIRYNFKIIYVDSPPDFIALWGIVSKYILKKKFVFKRDDIYPELYCVKYSKKKIIYRLLLMIEKIAHRTADISLVLNDSTKELILSRVNISKDRIKVIRFGPDIINFLPSKTNHFVKKNKYLIGYVGVLAQQENIDGLLRIFETLLSLRKSFETELVIVGDGPEANQFISFAEIIGISKYVNFVGRKSWLDGSMMDILNKCDLFVCPDEKNDMNDRTTMSKVMEYMALCKPIVMYDLKENRITAEDAGIYVDSGNELEFAKQINYLLENKSEREFIGMRGYQIFIEKWQWTHQKTKLIEVFNNL